MDQSIFASATSIAAAISSKRISAREALEAHLARIADVNPRINAVVTIDPDAARAAADAADAALAAGPPLGPLHGVPFTAKDTFDTAGLRSTAGTAGYAARVPANDAAAVARLKAAGAVLLGKTNTSELALTYESDNLLFGRSANPYDPDRTAGGSSGGEAAIIAAGGSPLGIGSDLGGSIRLPAHYCGIAGLKPTSGRVPATGHFPPLVGPVGLMAACGPMARSVEDLRLALAIMAGPDGRHPNAAPVPLDWGPVDLSRLRVATFTDNPPYPPTPATVAAVHRAAEAAGGAGARIVDQAPPALDQAFGLFMALLGADAGAGTRRLLELAATTDRHPATLGLLGALAPHGRSAAEYSGLLAARDQLRGAWLEFFEHCDALICPVNSRPALPHATTHEHLPAFAYTMAYNLTDLPVVTVRAGTSPKGLPIGVQVVARPWREDVALAVARAIEAAGGPWAHVPL